jgi:hypothetical protein
MRARGVETANAVYDDWVMTVENGEEVYYALQDICADMAFAMRTLLKTYSAGRDIISVDVDDAYVEANEGVILEGIMRKYLKHSLLAWWYANRDADLAEMNASKSAESLNNLFTQCLPRTATRVGHYF